MAINQVTESIYRLAYIETLPSYRHNGYATIAVAWLCQLADEYRITIELCPLQMEDQTPDVVKLTAWYQSLGFRRVGLQDEMVRYPKREYQERIGHEKKTPYLIQ